MILIPAMDILDGEVVRLYKGDYGQKTVYSDDPISVASAFAAAGVQRLHLVDLSGARDGQPQSLALFSEIKNRNAISIEAGGGIRNREQAAAYLSAQMDYLMIGTLPVKNLDEFKAIVELAGAIRILLTVDVLGREVRVSGWMEGTSLHISDFMESMVEMGISQFLVTQIEKDGTLQGPDFALYGELMQKFPGIFLIASGGVSSVDDLYALREQGLSAAIIGKAFYENKITLSDIAAFA